jgi:hypothetical protein
MPSAFNSAVNIGTSYNTALALEIGHLGIVPQYEPAWTRVRLTIEPSTPKVESCKFRPRFDIAVVVGLQPVHVPVLLATLIKKLTRVPQFLPL